MVSTPEEVTDESPHAPMTSIPVKKPRYSKSLCLFTKVLNIQNKTVRRLVGAVK